MPNDDKDVNNVDIFVLVKSCLNCSISHFHVLIIIFLIKICLFYLNYDDDVEHR